MRNKQRLPTRRTEEKSAFAPLYTPTKTSKWQCRRRIISGSVSEAFSGAFRTLRNLPTAGRRLRFLAYFSRLVFDAQLFNLRHVDVGLRTAAYIVGGDDTFSRRDAGYGDHEQQRLTVNHRKSAADAPVVLFVPGGAWGSADLLMYSLLGRKLAEEGCIGVVMTYRFYPHGNVGDMIEDVHLAIDWCLKHGPELGGDVSRFTIFAHSAGAQLVFLDILRRCRESAPMPHIFVGSCGVYNIKAHYEYEAWRGVSEMSTMKPAMGGAEFFDKFSPTLALDSNENKSLWHESHGISIDENLRAQISNLDLKGERWAKRAGFHPHVPNNGTLPLCVLQTSGKDSTVPWHSSAELYHALKSKDVRTLMLLYDDVEHSDFVADWMRNCDRDNRRRLFVPESMSGLRDSDCDSDSDSDPRWNNLALHVQDALKLIFRLNPLDTKDHVAPLLTESAARADA
eukprot:Plantae.Rhodophyta-Purpureofilum_apyrenoidigerum.ctg1195.p1 GENE.Plantae.Rhodophyta-Purpureofilum_apyrenoidigerum.ctg1195~~Plantae.Rhodophyta-Purpureofilum_apyrenoidigerum.ctg1195.p1  ORF type:complete len:453 (-),score=59.25 Plantae.Rhodophyta-Purpureofilum_apyrenoidigerum.ctg1195:73-1431(-)